MNSEPQAHEDISAYKFLNGFLSDRLSENERKRSKLKKIRNYLILYQILSQIASSLIIAINIDLQINYLSYFAIGFSLSSGLASQCIIHFAIETRLQIFISNLNGLNELRNTLRFKASKYGEGNVTDIQLDSIFDGAQDLLRKSNKKWQEDFEKYAKQKELNEARRENEPD